MTTYNLSVNGANGGASITQNVNTTDTVQITVSLPFGTFISSINASNCSRSPASMSSGSTATISFSGTGSYSVFFLGSTGGKSPTFYSATLNGTVGTSSVTAPTASSVSFNNPASANTTATVNLSASGSGGTLQYACEVGDTTPDNWQSGNTFTISRGSGTVYARARRSSTTNSNVVSATRPGFLTGDTAVSATSSNISTAATSAVTTLSSATAGEYYGVRINNGTGNLATRIGNGAISFSSNLPSSGNSVTYEIFVARPTSTGGDGSTYIATNDTFTVSRSAASGGGGVGGGSSTFGIKVYDTNGTTSVLSPSTRYMTRLADPVSITVAANGGTVNVACDMTHLAADNSSLVIEGFTWGDLITVTRLSNAFRVKNNNTNTFTSIVYPVRF
jgi:hypothetical protein